METQGIKHPRSIPVAEHKIAQYVASAIKMMEKSPRDPMGALWRVLHFGTRRTVQGVMAALLHPLCGLDRLTSAPAEHNGVTVAAGASALMLAALASRRDVVDALINEHDADICAVNQGDLSTVLHIAIAVDAFEVVKLLLSSANVRSILNHRAYPHHLLTPLHMAVKSARPLAYCQLLLDAGADPSIENKAGANALMSAGLLREGSAPIVKLFLQEGASINAGITGYGNIPLIYGTVSRSLETIEALLDAGSDIAARNHGGHTVLHREPAFTSEQILRLLIAEGGNLFAVDHQGKLPMHPVVVNCRERFKERQLPMEIDKV